MRFITSIMLYSVCPIATGTITLSKPCSEKAIIIVFEYTLILYPLEYQAKPSFVCFQLKTPKTLDPLAKTRKLISTILD